MIAEALICFNNYERFHLMLFIKSMYCESYNYRLQIMLEMDVNEKHNTYTLRNNFVNGQ